MGVDIEIVKEQNIDILQGAVSANELDLLKLYGIDTPFGYTAFWSAKEALSKTLRTGLTIDLDMLHIYSVKP